MKRIGRKNKKVKEEKADESMDEMNMRIFHMLKDKINEIEGRVRQHDEAIDKLMSKSENEPVVIPVDDSVDTVTGPTEPSLIQHYDDVCKEIDEKLK